MSEISGQVNYKQANKLLSMINYFKKESNIVWGSKWLDNTIKVKIHSEKRTNLIHSIDKMKIHLKTMRYLLEQIENDKYSYLKQTIFNILFRVPNKDFYQLLQTSQGNVGTLKEVGFNEDYNVQIFNYKYRISLNNITKNT